MVKIRSEGGSVAGAATVVWERGFHCWGACGGLRQLVGRCVGQIASWLFSVDALFGWWHYLSVRAWEAKEKHFVSTFSYVCLHLYLCKRSNEVSIFLIIIIICHIKYFILRYKLLLCS